VSLVYVKQKGQTTEHYTIQKVLKLHLVYWSVVGKVDVEYEIMRG
jgi:hypothetical protein